MKNFTVLLKYELHRLMVSSSTYIFSLMFACLTIFISAFLLDNFVKFDQDVPFVHMFFRSFWLPVSIVVSLITMRTMSESYKSGYFQSLFTTPISYGSVVLSKFLSVYLFYIFLWSFAIASLVIIGDTLGTALIDQSFVGKFNVFGGLFFYFLTGLFFVAVGILASSITENQVISGMTTFFVLLLFFVGGLFLDRSQKIISWDNSYLEPLNAFSQLDGFCAGVFDTRTIIFYLTSCVLLLFLSKMAIRLKIG